MTYLYGDSTDSGLELNYIELLREFLDFAVQVMLSPGESAPSPGCVQVTSAILLSLTVNGPLSLDASTVASAGAVTVKMAARRRRKDAGAFLGGQRCGGEQRQGGVRDVRQLRIARDGRGMMRFSFDRRHAAPRLSG